MMKYDKDIVNRICTLIREDSYTIAEICQLVGINEDTFYEWKRKKPEFSDSIKKAQNPILMLYSLPKQRSPL